MTQPKKKAPRAPPKSRGCPLWMMTFGDAMSLLVTFFVMLIAFSSLETEKLTDVIGAMRGALGAAPMLTENPIPAYKLVEKLAFSTPLAETELDHIQAIPGKASEASFLSYKDLSEIVPLLIAYIGKEGNDPAADIITIQMMNEGLSIVLLTEPLFEKGSDRLIQEYRSLWNGIAELLSRWDNELRITAILCTDYPVRTTSASTGWGLGILRAQQIAHRLQKAMNAPAMRFGIGTEIYHPVQDEPSKERIEIIISPPNYLLDLGSEQNWATEVWR